MVGTEKAALKTKNKECYQSRVRKSNNFLAYLVDKNKNLQRRKKKKKQFSEKKNELGVIVVYVMKN
jgi:hypothetical protein